MRYLRGQLGLTKVEGDDPAGTIDFGQRVSAWTGGFLPGGAPGQTPPAQPGINQGGQGGLINRAMWAAPPHACILASVDLPASELGSTNPEDVDDLRTLIPLLDAARQRTIGGALAAWAMHFPHAPAPDLILSTFGPDNAPKWALNVVRPTTPYDPILDSQPAIQPNDPRAPIFEAGLTFFFPDMVFDPLGNALRRGGFVDPQNGRRPGQGSMTIYGPFPWWVKFVTDPMLDLAVQVAKMPGAFSPATAAGGPDYLGDAVGRGLRAGAATGNPYVAAGQAVGSLVIDAISSIFGSSDPTPPAWLTQLMTMRQLRGDTQPGRQASFGQYQPGAGDYVHPRSVCRIAVINPPPGAKYTIEDGYIELMRRLGGGSSKSKLPTWLKVALAVGGAAIIGT